MPSSRGAFDCARLTAAGAVLFSHSYALTGNDNLEPLIWLTGRKASLGEIAVYAFFAISGYLVTQSWLRDPSLPRFMERRLRRVGPALVAVICGSFLIVGPLVTTLEFRNYFATPEAWSYLTKVLIYPPQYGLPGVFENNPFPLAVNGSLWTLRLEFALYLTIALLGCCGLLRRPLTALLAASCAAMSALVQWSPVRGTPFFHQVLVLFMNATPFFAGAVLAQSDVKSWKAGVGVPALAGVAIALLFISNFKIVLIVLLAVAVVLLCLHGRCGLRGFGDCSYGLYLWGFPVQQTVVHFAPGISPMNLFAVAGAATLACALLSWHGIEKAALRRQQKPEETALLPMAKTFPGNY